MKFLSFALLFSVFLFACSETEKHPTVDITTTKSQQHKNVTGTRVFVVPPAGFIASDAFQGFQKGESGMIQIMDLYGGSFYTNAATFNAEEFRKKGATVHSFHRYTINNDSVKRIELSTAQGERMTALVIGDSSYFVMFNCLWIASDSAAAKSVNEMLNTIYYDKAFTPDPLAGAAFTVDESVSAFAFLESAAGMYIFTIDGQKDNSGKSPVITIMQTPSSVEVNNESMQDILLSKLQQYGLTNTKLIRSEKTIINGTPALESMITGTMNNKEMVLYLLTTNAKGKMIALQALTQPNAETEAQIIAFAHSLKFK